jgi:hypothetical protein
MLDIGQIRRISALDLRICYSLTTIIGANIGVIAFFTFLLRSKRVDYDPRDWISEPHGIGD